MFHHVCFSTEALVTGWAVVRPGSEVDSVDVALEVFGSLEAGVTLPAGIVTFVPVCVQVT